MFDNPATRCKPNALLRVPVVSYRLADCAGDTDSSGRLTFPSVQRRMQEVGRGVLQVSTWWERLEMSVHISSRDSLLLNPAR